VVELTLEVVQPPALLDRLREAPGLRHLTPDELERLARRGRLSRFEAGQLLLRQGDPAECVLLLLEGSATVHADDEGSEVLARREGTVWLGEAALFDEHARTASVRAEKPVVALELDRSAFLASLGSSPEATLDLLRTLFERVRESDSERIELLRQRARDLERENRKLRDELDERHGFASFVGSSPAAERVREAARTAAATDLPVLLIGDTGSGKEVLARAIHHERSGPEPAFVALNCGLFTEPLLESELFGHARGAFTGATQAREGLVAAADGGSLFLDEIGDMPPALQGALLRFLELGEYRRVGESRIRRARPRVIAATHRDLGAGVRDGSFRQDLLYRLDVLRIELPPLRERPEDLQELVTHLAARVAARLGSDALRLDRDALAALEAYPFPGNVRELVNEIERLYAVHGGGLQIPRAALAERILDEAPAAQATYSELVRTYKARLVKRALRDAEGSRSRAAALLGVDRSNFLRMMRELRVDAPPARARADRRSPR
jgi:DNA-binding NtrC family response regulator